LFYIDNVFLYKRRLYFFFKFLVDQKRALVEISAMYWDTNREHVIEQALSIVLIILLIKRKLAPSHFLLCQCLLYCRVHSFCISVRFSTTLSFRLRFVNSDLRRPRNTFFISAHSIVVPILFASTLVSAALLLSVFVYVVPSLLHQHHCISVVPIHFHLRSFLSQLCFSSA